MVVGSKRRYYRASNSGVARSVEGYMVKWLDNSDSFTQVKNAGPFKNMEEAAELLQTNLKSGICSWMVSYDE